MLAKPRSRFGGPFQGPLLTAAPETLPPLPGSSSSSLHRETCTAATLAERLRWKGAPGTCAVLLKTGSATAACSGLCPVGVWVFPTVETPHLVLVIDQLLALGSREAAPCNFSQGEDGGLYGLILWARSGLRATIGSVGPVLFLVVKWGRKKYIYRKWGGRNPQGFLFAKCYGPLKLIEKSVKMYRTE